MLQEPFLYLWSLVDNTQSLLPTSPCGTRTMRWLGVILPYASHPPFNKPSPAIPPRFSGMLSRIGMVRSQCPASTKISKRRFLFALILTSIPLPNSRKWLPPLLVLVQSQLVLVQTRPPLPRSRNCRHSLPCPLSLLNGRILFPSSVLESLSLT